MGNVHRGHRRLSGAGREQGQRVVSSVFVNPLQFGLNEDFDRYPRTLDADAAQLAQAGCDLLFAPSVTEMYPHGREGFTVISVPRYAHIRSEEHTSELQSLMRISYAVFCLKKKK